MSENGKNRASNEYRRRAILRSAGAAGASMALGGGVVGTVSAATACHLPDQSEQASEENYEWRRSNSNYYVDSYSTTYDHLTELQSGLVYQGSTYIDDVSRWYHFFRSFGAGYTQRKPGSADKSEYDPIQYMTHQELKISNDNTSVASLYTTDNPADVGAAPSPNNGDDLNYDSAAWTVALAALATTNTYAAVAIPAGQALAALLDNGESDSGDTVTYMWDYENGSGPCEAVHFANYEFHSHDGESHCDFHVRQEVGHYGHYWAKNRYDVYVDPVPDNVQSVDGSTTSDTSTASAGDHPLPSDSGYTDFLERTNAATKVPFDDIENSRVKELADAGPVYRARNPYSEVTKSSGPDGSVEK